MEPEILASLVLLVCGALLALVGNRTEELQYRLKVSPKTRSRGSQRARSQGGQWLLRMFAGVVLLYGLVIAVVRWDWLRTNSDRLLLAGGLFLCMAGGMFVQVLARNYQSGKPLLAVTTDQLVYPLLFAPIVFYPTWLVGAAATPVGFAVYAAFLNGYFWESVVQSVARPQGRGGDQGDA